jgi:hypothetical protein
MNKYTNKQYVACPHNIYCFILIEILKVCNSQLEIIVALCVISLNLFMLPTVIIFQTNL